MKGMLLSALLSAAMWFTPGAHSESLGIMVPAYFSPSSGYWSSMNYAASRVPLIAIMNPDNGPGTSPSSSYVNVLAQLHSSGGKITGYIYTSYGARALADVEADIDRYLAWYAVDGFFVDEMTSDAGSTDVNYYATLYQYIKAKGTNYSVTANPGVNAPESYITTPVADTLMIFENDGSKYPAFAPSSWVAKYSPDHFVHLPYNATNTATLSNFVALAVNRNAGWIYISDLSVYSKLPTYWTNEVLMAQAFNQEKLSPFILTSGQPASQVAGTGDSATFTVAAFGSPLPAYQWFYGTNAITTATNASYTIASVQAANAGYYDVQIENSNGFAISREASLIVSNGPSSYRKIILDGSFNDWTGLAPVYTAAIGPATTIQYENIYLANDESNLYIRVTLYSPRTNAFANSYDNIFIDADDDASTGYQVEGIGSSLLIQSGNGYQEKNGGFNEGTVNNLGWTIARSADETDCELAVSRNAAYAADGSSIFSGNKIALLFQGDDASHDNVEDAPPSGGIAYSFATSPTVLPPLSISCAAGIMTITWSGLGTLQTCNSITGNSVWTNITGAASPYVAPIAGSQFFRLVQ
ncbi:MAG TPA: spherulation-specific family 4 protein [Verrucomicrobiae bacterium]|jgi:hypothetical protein|nr:spherulation-specific family 4 protein [Verrucomicrobiae bacterium]